MTDEKVRIIEIVKTPLAFFVLVVLLVEVIFGLTASKYDAERTVIVVAMITLIFLLVGIVAFLAYYKPEALSGKKSEDPELDKIRQEFQEKEHLADMIAGEWTFLTHYQPEEKLKTMEVKGCCEIKKGKYGIFMHGNCLDQEGKPSGSFVVKQAFINDDGLTYIYEVPQDLGKATLGVGQVEFVNDETETMVSQMLGNWGVLGSKIGGKAEFIRKT